MRIEKQLTMGIKIRAQGVIYDYVHLAEYQCQVLAGLMIQLVRIYCFVFYIPPVNSITHELHLVDLKMTRDHFSGLWLRSNVKMTRNSCYNYFSTLFYQWECLTRPVIIMSHVQTGGCKTVGYLFPLVSHVKPFSTVEASQQSLSFHVCTSLISPSSMNQIGGIFRNRVLQHVLKSNQLQ